MGIRLTWTDPNFGEDGHNIYRSTSPMDPEALPAPYDTVGPNVEVYDDGAVTEGETYYYRVSAFLGSSTELVSEEVEILASDFTPADLFDSSTDGAWYDPSDLSTLFQDAGGTTPVAADGDPVGLMQDKSPNGNHVSQSVSASRPVYRTDGTLHWLEFDGVDDVLESAALSSTIVDNGGLISSSWQSAVDEALGGVVEEVWADGDTTTSDERVALYADTRTTPMRFLGYMPDATSRTIDLLSKNAPNTGYVSVGNSDGANIVGRLNAVEQGSVSASANFTKTPTKFVLGRQSEGDLYLSGKVYSAVITSEGQSSATVSQLENYLAQKAGVTL